MLEDETFLDGDLEIDEFLEEDTESDLVDDVAVSSNPELLIDDSDYLFEEVQPNEQENNLTPVDFDDYTDSLQSVTEGDSSNNSAVSNEIFNIADGLANSVKSENGEDEQSEDDVLDSILITQQNIKTGFDNLTLIGSVQTGLTAFGIGAIIIYCFIGRFK